MRISLIVALAENGVIGRDGGLPWRLRSDLRRFRALTLGKPLIMGRKTFESLKAPLDGRDNIVVSRDPAYAAPGALPAASLEAALKIGRDCAARRGVEEIMVIGGAEIYRAATAMADRIYLTLVHAKPQGDATFAFPDQHAWRETERQDVPPGEADEHPSTYLVFDRNSDT